MSEACTPVDRAERGDPRRGLNRCPLGALLRIGDLPRIGHVHTHVVCRDVRASAHAPNATQTRNGCARAQLALERSRRRWRSFPQVLLVLRDGGHFVQTSP